MSPLGLEPGTSHNPIQPFPLELGLKGKKPLDTLGEGENERQKKLEA